MKLPTTAKVLGYLVNIAQRSLRPLGRSAATSMDSIKYHQNIMIGVKEFNDAIKEVEISEWRHLSVGEIYEIVDYVIMESPYGESMKLTVKDQEGVLYTVWAPEEVRATLCPLGERKEYTHIRSNGLKTRKYWSFDAVQVVKKDMYV